MVVEEKQKNVGKRVKSVNKKSIVPSRAVRGLINGFVSYGILLIFIFLTIVVLTTWLVENNKKLVNVEALKYTLPIMAAFLIFFLIRATCHLSTFDLFKKCKIEKEEINGVCTKMNFFYICVVAFFTITIIVYMITRFSNEKVQISREIMLYNQSNSVYAVEKENELIAQYEKNKSNTIIQTLIVEMGLLLGVFSLIPSQRKLIEKYN